ncbi:MAG: 50S ribosomal protein L29 [Alphaproteobacteria bacterium]|nr:50S ribosomal protein L29 [Alphaproteobacteria bacterium]MBL0718173.1 50S ribosomal protein L29 [Alphaproteobacteria bacterium]
MIDKIDRKKIKTESLDVLRTKLKVLKKELMEARHKNAIQKLEKTHVVRICRRNIARINTAITMAVKKLNKGK